MLESVLHGEHSIVVVMLFSYIAGILASFTPCIYPMIPITLGIITAQRSSSMLTNFFLALSYGFGIATIYAILGYISATSSVIFGQWLAHPLFILPMIAFFCYLAFSMFGFYEMYTPKFLQAAGTSQRKGGSFAYSYLFGLFSGAAASPCLTPALAMLLGFVAKQGNPLAGLFVLFAFAMGLSTLLIVVGTFSSSLTLLPRAGSWMSYVKTVFGFLLLLVCVSFLEPIVLPYIVTLLRAFVLFSASFYYFYRSSRGSQLSLALVCIATLLFISGVLVSADCYLQTHDTSLQEYTEEFFNNRHK